MKSHLFACFIFLGSYVKAQPYLEPILGYSTDLNNSGFRQLNVALQLAQKSGTTSEFVMQLQTGLPLSTASSQGQAYTANPALPLSTTAQKRISPFSIGFFPGWRIRLGKGKSNDRFFAVPMIGLQFERIGVRYNYDKNNYTILNPDKSLNKLGAAVSLSVEYMHLLRTGRIFTAIRIIAPSIGPRNNYPSSFRFTFPLSVQMGYSFHLTK